MSKLALKLIEIEKIEKTGFLDLGNCGLVEPPKELFDLTWLKELHFCSVRWDWNQRVSVRSKNTVDSISSNLLVNISDGFSKLKFLRFLSLSLGGESIGRLSILKKLNFLKGLEIQGENKMDLVFLDKLHKLEFLLLDCNVIQGAENLSKLKNLKAFRLKTNLFFHFWQLGKLTQLKHLKIESSENFNIGLLENLTELEYLDLSNNQISDLDSLERLTKLESLNLSNNKISSTISLKKLTKLKSLNLANNLVSRIWSLKSFDSLKNLDLVNNQISDITPLLELNDLEIIWKEGKVNLNGKINVFDNPLGKPPIEIVKQGNKAIIKYFEELDIQGTVDLYEAKMLIIGQGGVGKTSLAKKIMNSNAKLPNEEDTTKGIEIQEYYFQTREGKDFRINIWDFGGQEIYHSTHQFFLTKRSLYILVDDTRQDDKSSYDASFNYWLETVKLLGGESPIVIVQNEKGGRGKDLNLKDIQSKYSNVKEIYTTNLKTCEKLEETKKALELYVQRLPIVGQQLPRQWVKIRNALEKIGRSGIPHITFEKYMEVCANHKIPEENRALVLSQYLHDLGVFLHFQKDDVLGKTIILNNEWATDAVYKVLDCEKVKDAKGQFTRDDLKLIWGDKKSLKKYEHMHGQLLALMKNFELCYELKSDKNKFIAPQLFPSSQPDYDWDAENNLILLLKYEFMPKGIMGRFIVRLHHYVNDLKTAWGNGVLLKRKETLAEIINLYARQEIRIRLKGKESKEFLDIIIEEFEQIHSQFKGIEVDKLIPCNCIECVEEKWKEKYYFKYEVLKNAHYKEINEVQCQYSFDSVNLYLLINDTLIATRISGDKINKIPEYSEKEKLEELVIDNNIAEVFETLQRRENKVKLKKEIALLKSRWKKNEQERRQNGFPIERFNIEGNRINKALLEIIEEMDW